MATGTYGIATEGDLYTAFSVGTMGGTKCVTKSRVEELGLKTTVQYYADDQLVEFSDISPENIYVDDYITSAILNMNKTTVATDDSTHIIVNNLPSLFVGAEIVFKAVTPANTLSTQLASWRVLENQVQRNPVSVQIASGNASYFGLGAANISKLRVVGVTSNYSYLTYSGKDIRWSLTNTPTGGSTTGNVTLNFVNNGYTLYYSTTPSGTGTVLSTGKPGSVSISNVKSMYVKAAASNTYLYLSKAGNPLSVDQYDHRQSLGTTWTKISYSNWTSGASYNFTVFNR
jgi:hypothetical protein